MRREAVQELVTKMRAPNDGHVLSAVSWGRMGRSIFLETREGTKIKGPQEIIRAIAKLRLETGGIIFVDNKAIPIPEYGKLVEEVVHYLDHVTSRRKLDLPPRIHNYPLAVGRGLGKWHSSIYPLRFAADNRHPRTTVTSGNNAFFKRLAAEKRGQILRIKLTGSYTPLHTEVRKVLERELTGAEVTDIEREQEAAKVLLLEAICSAKDMPSTSVVVCGTANPAITDGTRWALYHMLGPSGHRGCRFVENTSNLGSTLAAVAPFPEKLIVIAPKFDPNEDGALFRRGGRINGLAPHLQRPEDYGEKKTRFFTTTASDPAAVMQNTSGIEEHIPLKHSGLATYLGSATKMPRETFLREAMKVVGIAA